MRLLAAALVAVTGLPAAPAPGQPAAATWSVVPAGTQGPDGRTALDYKLDPGAELTDHVAVANHSRKPLTLRLYASDALTTPGGGFDLLPGDRKPVDAGAWVTVTRPEVTVPPRTRVLVPVRIAVPRNATPGDHTGGVVASLRTSNDAAAVAVDHRAGTRIHLRVAGPLRPALTIRDVRVTRHVPWNPFRFPAVTAEFTVANTGNLRLTGRPAVRTQGVGGWARRQTAGPDVPQVLPGGAVRQSLTSSALIPVLRVWVTTEVRPQTAAAGAADATHTTAIWLVPWPQLALLGAVLLLVLAWRLRRRQLRAALAAAEERGRAAPKENR